jgi:hypothetical protein
LTRPVSTAEPRHGRASRLSVRLRLPDKGGADRANGHDQTWLPAWLQRVRDSRAAQASISGAALAIMLHLRYGYLVGDRDHHVLSPRGLQWVHPDWFVNDWTVTNAPQPHWFFDIVTWAGEASHTLIFLYLAYWLAAMAAFGAATTILSRTWTPRHPWLATAFVTVGSAVTPIDNLGSGSLWFATPLPNILGGCLLLLTTTGLLTGRHRLAAFAGTATALVHVQHGTVTTVLFVLMGLWTFKRERKIDWNLVGGAGGSLAFTVLALQLRPIAGHISDFTEACHVIIPYHCEANTWTKSYILGGTAVVFLGLLTVFFLARSERYRWAIVVALPAFGLLSGVAADKVDIPFFGTLAQGLNIPRLMLVVLPLSLWGVLVPVLADLTPRRRWLLTGVVIVLGMFALRLGWAVDKSPTLRSSLLILGFAGCIVLGVVALTVPGIARWPELLRSRALAGTTLFVLASIVVGHTMQLRPVDIRMFPQGELKTWGDKVQHTVPVGGQILIPPTAYELRMITKRAVVVDCKYGPYGGAAWAEYKSRMEQLGGFGQCLGTLGAPAYHDLSGAELAAVADRYGAQYILTETVAKPLTRNMIESRVPEVPLVDGEPELIPNAQGQQLLDRGWTVAVPPGDGVAFYVFRAP